MENINEILSRIRKDFYKYRNGIVADSIKRMYPSGTMIFGLNVPQFMELAAQYQKDIELGKALWADESCREARLLALYLTPHSDVNFELAGKMINDVRNIEEAEFLSFRLLRHLAFAKDLLETFKSKVQTGTPSAHSLIMLEKALSGQS